MLRKKGGGRTKIQENIYDLPSSFLSEKRKRRGHHASALNVRFASYKWKKKGG